MATTMKALRKMQAAKGLQMESVAIPAIGARDVLVRVKAASICGTDLHIYGWDRWSQGRIKPPVTLGHEFCGVVERVGEEVTAVQAGDFVSAEMHVNCGYCHQCRLGGPRHNQPRNDWRHARCCQCRARATGYRRAAGGRKG